MTLPEPTRAYLGHAIAPGTVLASSVRLIMHGEIKLGRWLPFTAEQTLDRSSAMIWRASVRMFGLPITGFDRLWNGEGEMRWKFLGIFPVMTASGPDITRSARGRVLAESMWLPSRLAADDVTWADEDASHAVARVESEELKMTIDGAGRLQSLSMQRWAIRAAVRFDTRRLEPLLTLNRPSAGTPFVRACAPAGTSARNALRARANSSG